jgi:hypothetical protein
MQSLNDLSQFAISIQSRLDQSSWRYDPISGRYRGSNGRFLSQSAVEALVDGRIDKLGTLLRRLTGMLSDGSITLDQWQQSVREALKLAHVQAAIIGNGGKDNMLASDWGRIGQRLRAEYRYLESFARDLLAGSISAPMALARIGMYSQSVRGSYWEGATIRQEKQGYSLMRRILDSQAKHCQDCLDFAARGVVPVGSLPLPGQRCACRSNCKCRVQYLRQQAPVVPI